jgi:hypothetical protein
MRNGELTAVIVLVGLFILLPSLSNKVMYVFHHPIFIFMVILALLWLTTKSAQMGVLGLLVLGALILERNRRTLFTAMGVAGAAPRMPQDASMPISPSLRFVDYQVPDVARYPYAPPAGCDTGAFAPVGQSVDDKKVLKTVPPGEATMKQIFAAGAGKLVLPMDPLGN